MDVFGFTIGRSAPQTLGLQTKETGMSLVTHLPSRSLWHGIWEWGVGSWQRHAPAQVNDVLSHSTAWSCITLIANDIAKVRLKLTKEGTNGICEEVDAGPAYQHILPLLKTPNHFQNRIQFIKSWVISKLTRGNTYVLKERDRRGTVSALYVLEPSRVQVMVAPNGEVFYSLGVDNLSGLQESVVVPATEIIHDVYFAPYHPLCGVSPIIACGMAVTQGLKILENSARLFANGSQLSGVLSAPGNITNDVAERLQTHWENEYTGDRGVGRVAVLGDGLKFTPNVMTAVDAQLIDQLNWSDKRVCSTYHVPAFMVGVGEQPPYNNIDALQQQYYSQCLQVLVEELELCLKEGLSMDDTLYAELDLDELLRMDASTKVKTNTDSIRGMLKTPNEGRRAFNLPPLDGGDTLYGQEQDHSLQWLSKRDQMPIVPKPAPPAAAPVTPAPAGKEIDMDELYAATWAIRSKALGLPEPVAA